MKALWDCESRGPKNASRRHVATLACHTESTPCSIILWGHAGLLRTQSRPLRMMKHLQSNVDSELERWIVRHCAGALQSAYAEVRINGHGAVNSAPHGILHTRCWRWQAFWQAMLRPFDHGQWQLADHAAKTTGLVALCLVSSKHCRMLINVSSMS